MTITFEQAEAAQEKFIREYMNDQEKYSGVVRGVLVTFLNAIDKVYLDRVTLQQDESLDDFCMRVYLVKEPDKNIKLPDKYMGVRIFYEMKGYPQLAYKN